ncbi:hypothetical protein ACN469_07280 [Corallococcus terminator]
MPRTSQEQTQERHAFLLTLFRQQPDISSKDALESFKGKFGSTINLKTFNQLRAEAEEEVAAAPATEEPEAEVESAPETAVEDAATQLKAAATATSDALNGAQPAKKPKAKGTGSKNVFVDAPKEHLSFLESIVQQLQEAGAANVRIDHSTDRWMVLVVDPK